MVMASRGSSSASKPPAGPNSRTERGVDKCQVFYNSLSDKLEALEQAVQPKWLTLEWVSLAVDFMRSTFADMMILFEDVRALMPDVKVSHEYWIEEYMVESMKLLDVCNVLKPAVSRFENFIMCAQLVVPAMQRYGAIRIPRCRSAAKMLRTWSLQMRRRRRGWNPNVRAEKL